MKTLREIQINCFLDFKAVWKFQHHPYSSFYLYLRNRAVLSQLIAINAKSVVRQKRVKIAVDVESQVLKD